MRLFHGLARRWNAIWFSPASPYPIAAFRILLAIFLLGYLGALAPFVSVLFSSEGVYAPYVLPDLAPPPAAAYALYGLMLLLCGLLLLGFRSGLVIPCLLVLFFHHYFLSLAVRHSSFDRLIAIYLLILWPARADAVWGWSSSTKAAETASFAGRLIRFQTIVLYLGAGLWKALNPAWQSGELLRSTLLGVWATPLAFWAVRQQPEPAFWAAASWGVISFELALAALLWIRATRPVAIVLGIAFHLLNSVVIAIPEFLVCLAPYVFFVHEDTPRRWGMWLANALRRPRAPL
jgi:hypothetical protein